MTPADPQGSYVDANEARRTAATTIVSPEPGWLESTFDLQHGVRVVETPLDALPDELVEQFRTRRR